MLSFICLPFFYPLKKNIFIRYFEIFKQQSRNLSPSSQWKVSNLNDWFKWNDINFINFTTIYHQNFLRIKNNNNMIQCMMFYKQQTNQFKYKEVEMYRIRNNLMILNNIYEQKQSNVQKGVSTINQKMKAFQKALRQQNNQKIIIKQLIKQLKNSQKLACIIKYYLQIQKFMNQESKSNQIHKIQSDNQSTVKNNYIEFLKELNNKKKKNSQQQYEKYLISLKQKQNEILNLIKNNKYLEERIKKVNQQKQALLIINKNLQKTIIEKELRYKQCCKKIKGWQKNIKQIENINKQFTQNYENNFQNIRKMQKNVMQIKNSLKQHLEQKQNLTNQLKFQIQLLKNQNIKLLQDKKLFQYIQKQRISSTSKIQEQIFDFLVNIQRLRLQLTQTKQQQKDLYMQISKITKTGEQQIKKPPINLKDKNDKDKQKSNQYNIALSKFFKEYYEHTQLLIQKYQEYIKRIDNEIILKKGFNKTKNKNNVYTLNIEKKSFLLRELCCRCLLPTQFLRVQFKDETDNEIQNNFPKCEICQKKFYHPQCIKINKSYLNCKKIKATIQKKNFLD